MFKLLQTFFNGGSAGSHYHYIDRLGLIFVLLGSPIIMIGLIFNLDILLVVAVPLSFTGAIMVIDAAIHESEWMKL